MDVQFTNTLVSLIGTWHVEMTTVDASGRLTFSDRLVAEKRWFGGERYVEETIAGEFAGERHEKRTLLAYNRTRARFEYMTADNHDTVLLLYASPPGDAGDGREITLFAEYAMPDERDAERATFVTIRTTLTVISPSQHEIRNAYRFASGVEKPFLTYVYRRV